MFKYDIIGYGNPFQDLVVDIDKLPENNKKTYMHTYSFQGGGNIPTAIVAASVLGAKCAVYGNAGDDMFGRAAVEDFAFNGVDTSHLRLQANRRSDFTVCVAERLVGGKEFIIKLGDYDEYREDELDIGFLSSTRMLHVGGFVTPAMLKASEIVHASGGEVSIDAAYYRPDITENLDKLDIFIASETYYDAMCADMGKMSCMEAVRYIHSKGPKIAIITLGEKGCVAICDKCEFTVPAFKVDAVDTTGAGDVFHGAFDYAYLQGMDCVESARFSSAVSAIKCTRNGGRSGIPDSRTAQRFLDSSIIDYTEIDKRVERYQRGFFIK